jgi:DNA-binding XRE family transcriptional regulator
MNASQRANSAPDQGPGHVEPSTAPAGATDQDVFVHGNERLRALRDRHPELADAVAARRAELRQADRDHAMGLAMIRQAANLTQTELASILGVGQAAVAKIEGRPDLLLSTLRGYLEALGGQASVIVDFGNGAPRIEVALDALVSKKRVEPPLPKD